jgi:hypothetical protein
MWAVLLAIRMYILPPSSGKKIDHVLCTFIKITRAGGCCAAMSLVSRGSEPAKLYWLRGGGRFILHTLTQNVSINVDTQELNLHQQSNHREGVKVVIVV